MAHLFFGAKFKGFDANGNVLAGGKLYSYAAGTATPLATYTSQTEGAENANPTILDANGEASVWMGTSAYKFTLQTSAGAVVWTVDNVSHINPNGVTTGKIANSAVTTAKINDLAVTTAKIEDLNVTAAKLAVDSVTEAKILDGAVTENKIADGSVTADKIGPDAIGTSAIDDGAITRAKLESVGQQLSSASGSPFATNSTSYVDVTNLTVTITTTGRPVMLRLQAHGTATFVSYILAQSDSAVYVNFCRGATNVGEYFVDSDTIIPSSAISFVDTPAAGTYTYKVQVKKAVAGSGFNLGVYNTKLLAFEL